MRERLQRLTRLSVEFAKDTAAACVAELVAGRGLVIDGRPRNAVYVKAGAIAGRGVAGDTGRNVGGGRRCTRA